MPKVYVESPNSFRQGRATIAVINTAVALAAVSTPIQRVRVKALSGNTQAVYVGDNTVTSANGFPLAANVEVELFVNDLARVYINGGVVGEGIAYVAS